MRIMQALRSDLVDPNDILDFAYTGLAVDISWYLLYSALTGKTLFSKQSLEAGVLLSTYKCNSIYRPIRSREHFLTYSLET